MPATHYANNAILNYQFRGSAFSHGSHIGLSTSPIDADGSGAIEPDAASYSRQSGSALSWNFTEEGMAYNASKIDFPTCESSWGTIVEIFIVDAQTDGNILYHSRLSPSIPTYEGTTISINPNTLIVTERI